jgi:hypothetical protein
MVLSTVRQLHHIPEKSWGEGFAMLLTTPFPTIQTPLLPPNAIAFTQKFSLWLREIGKLGSVPRM